MDDYAFEPKAAPSIFLRLKDKDEKVVIRLVSKPYREPKVWKEGVQKPLDEDRVAELTEPQWVKLMTDPEYRVSELFHWVVLDRHDGDKAKIFQGAASVYKAIKNYAQMPQWGDPTKYDLEITRTEEPGNYYTVVPYPNKSEITGEEMIEAESIKITDKVKNARGLKDRQVDDTSEFQAQDNRKQAPAAAPADGAGLQAAKDARDRIAAKKAADIMGIDDNELIGGQPPIDLSEIPF